MSYQFYLGKILCPVPPSKIDIKVKGQNKTITLINEGEVNILKKSGLTDITFDMMIPNTKYPFAKYPLGFVDAKYFLAVLETLKTDKKPFQFIVTRTLPNGKILHTTNIKVSLEDYTLNEDAKEGFDVIVSIKLKQYRDFGTKTCVVKLANNKATLNTTATRSTETAPKIKSYTVKKGDCLWNIAKKYYGNGSKYTLIFNANKSKIQNPNLIYPGQVFTIPEG